MGKYINLTNDGFMGSTFEGRKARLLNDSAVMIEEPKEWEPGLVCLVENKDLGFSACAWANTESEMIRFKAGYDGRKYQWFKYPYASEFGR